MILPKPSAVFLCAAVSLAIVSCSRNSSVPGIYTYTGAVDITYDFRSDGTVHSKSEFPSVGNLSVMTREKDGKWRLEGGKLVVEFKNEADEESRETDVIRASPEIAEAANRADFTFESNGDLIMLPSANFSRSIRLIKK